MEQVIEEFNAFFGTDFCAPLNDEALAKLAEFAQLRGRGDLAAKILLNDDE